MMAKVGDISKFNRSASTKGRIYCRLSSSLAMCHLCKGFRVRAISCLVPGEGGIAGNELRTVI